MRKQQGGGLLLRLCIESHVHCAHLTFALQLRACISADVLRQAQPNPRCTLQLPAKHRPCQHHSLPSALPYFAHSSPVQ